MKHINRQKSIVHNNSCGFKPHVYSTFLKALRGMQVISFLDTVNAISVSVLTSQPTHANIRRKMLKYMLKSPTCTVIPTFSYISERLMNISLEIHLIL